MLIGTKTPILYYDNKLLHSVYCSCKRTPFPFEMLYCCRISQHSNSSHCTVTMYSTVLVIHCSTALLSHPHCIGTNIYADRSGHIQNLFKILKACHKLPFYGPCPTGGHFSTCTTVIMHCERTRVVFQTAEDHASTVEV